MHPRNPELIRRGGTLRGRGDWYGAELLGRAVLATQQRVLGPDHPDTLATKGNLAMLLAGRYDYARAEALQREVARVGEGFSMMCTHMRGVFECATISEVFE